MAEARQAESEHVIMMPMLPSNNATPSGVTVFNVNSRPLFEKARIRATLLAVLSRAMGKSRVLPQFEGRFSDIGQVQLCQVRLELIRGTITQTNTFDCDFYPITDEVEARWVRIASILMQGNTLPPVELIGVDDSYYVIDGHHRISVYRMMKQNYVDALVRFSEP